MRAALLAIAIACACAGHAPPPPAPAPAPVTIVLPCAPPPDAPIAAAVPDRENVRISDANPSSGSATALVTLVEFSELQCPYCARAAETLRAVRAKYRADELRIVWKNDPLDFHPEARPAAEAAMGVFALAGADAFWRFHDAAFANFHELAADRYEQWAADAGVTDLAAFRDGLASHRWAPVIDADIADADQVGLRGVPIFFIDGRRLQGAQPLEAFTRIIDEELAAARAR